MLVLASSSIFRTHCYSRYRWFYFESFSKVLLEILEALKYANLCDVRCSQIIKKSSEVLAFYDNIRSTSSITQQDARMVNFLHTLASINKVRNVISLEFFQ